MNAPLDRVPLDPDFAARCTLTIARAEVYAEDESHVASMQQTLMMLAGVSDYRADHPS